jgi:hypothetical protein
MVHFNGDTMYLCVVVDQAFEAAVGIGEDFYLPFFIKRFASPANLPPHEMGQVIVLQRLRETLFF